MHRFKENPCVWCRDTFVWMLSLNEKPDLAENKTWARIEISPMWKICKPDQNLPFQYDDIFFDITQNNNLLVSIRKGGRKIFFYNLFLLIFARRKI